MDNNKKIFRITTLLVTSTILLLVVYLHLLSHEKTKNIFLEQTEKTVLNLKKDFLMDTVNNVIAEIDTLRETKYSNYKKNTEQRLKRVQEKLALSEEGFEEFFINSFQEDGSSMWTAFLWNKETGDILFESFDSIGTVEETIQSLKASLSNYVVVNNGNLEGIFGVSKSYIDELVKEEMGDILRTRTFSNDSYIWVNEIINYEGGKDYAIRRVHPNLIETEGMYLSTDMEDVKGNLPFLAELEGIQENGEFFQTYYFKRLDSSVISEKVSYAKLYKDYDWIIAMGVHVDDIDAFAHQINHEISSLTSESIFRMLPYILVVLIIGFIVLYFVERRYIISSTKSLEKQINIDGLTKAYSRRAGETRLSVVYKDYRKMGYNPAIMMFDVDDFKYINDSYGHDVGDLVLKQIVKVVNRVIRSSDQLIRWGGDEFVGIFPGLREEHIMDLGDKLLDAISALRIPVEDNTIKVTVSMGFTYFKEADSNYRDVLKRADEAMYQSKHAGKGKVSVEI